MKSSDKGREIDEISGVYEFDLFKLDTSKHLLTKEGKPVLLTYKALQTLIVLVEGAGNVVEKDVLISRVWQDTFVEENSLARNISAIRKALGEIPAANRFIETVPRRGYRFVAEVTKSQAEYHDQRADAQELILDESASPNFGITEQSFTSKSESQAESDSSAPVNRHFVVAEEINPKEKAARLPLLHRRPIHLLILLIIIGFGFVVFFPVRILPTGIFSQVQVGADQNFSVTKFTNKGNAMDAAISPDGKYVVYTIEEGSQQSLWMKQTAVGGAAVQIVQPMDVAYQGLAFSPDGNFIYYNLWDKTSVGAIYRIPTLGGASRKIINDCMPSVAISPDGQQLAFIRGYAENNEQAIIIADSEGREEKVLMRPDNRHWFAFPAWSPNGKKLAVGLGIYQSRENNHYKIIEFFSETGKQQALTDKVWSGLGGLAWLPEERGLLINGSEKAQMPFQIWRVSLPGGEVRQLTNDASGYSGGASVTADGNSFVAVQRDSFQNIWIAPSSKIAEAKKITEGRYDGEPEWTRDGKIVFRSLTSGNPDIWIMNADGTDKRQITDDSAADFNPVVSPIDNKIFFTSNRAQNFQIWRMDTDGKNLELVTGNTGGWAQTISSDGRWLVYANILEGKNNLWKMSLQSNDSPVRLTSFNSYLPAVSPDSQYVAFSFWDESIQRQTWKRAIISLDSGKPMKIFDLPTTAARFDGAVMLRWLPDQSGLAFVNYENGVANIWVSPLDKPESPYQLTDYTDGRIFEFNWSPDGEKFIISRGAELSDVVLIKNL